METPKTLGQLMPTSRESLVKTFQNNLVKNDIAKYGIKSKR